MSEDKMSRARKEIHRSLELCHFCTRWLGISFIDEPPSTLVEKLNTYFWVIFSAVLVFLLVFGEIVYVVKQQLISTTSVAQFVLRFHCVGYGIMSVCKSITIRAKKHVFKQLISELVEIWPVSGEEEVLTMKRESLETLRLRQLGYMFWNILGAALYSATPLLLHFYRQSRGLPSDLGYVWFVSYPFDKTRPIYHECAYVFEILGGILAVFSMLSSDMLFMTMSNHISLLLRLLQAKIRNLLPLDTDAENKYSEQCTSIDCYDDIVSVIQIHQRLISYSNDLENVFSLVNLVTVILSSVDICCVVFNIVLLEPWMEMSNKFFFGAALTQVGILCWYADDIYRASIGLADAVYESGWYKSNIRCRRALLLLLQRSQKPLYFTAFKFSNITMLTYNSILTKSYSYFALLYTVYSDK